MTDNGSISFPSITICKDEMYDHVNGLMKRLQSGELSVDNASSWFRNGFNLRNSKINVKNMISIFIPKYPQSLSNIKMSILVETFPKKAYFFSSETGEVSECEHSGGLQQISLQYRERPKDRRALCLSLLLP